MCSCLSSMMSSHSLNSRRSVSDEVSLRSSRSAASYRAMADCCASCPAIIVSALIWYDSSLLSMAAQRLSFSVRSTSLRSSGLTIFACSQLAISFPPRSTGKMNETKSSFPPENHSSLSASSRSTALLNSCLLGLVEDLVSARTNKGFWRGAVHSVDPLTLIGVVLFLLGSI